MDAETKRPKRKHTCPMRRAVQLLGAMSDRECEHAADLLAAFAKLCDRDVPREQRMMVGAFASLCGRIDEIGCLDVEDDAPMLRIAQHA